MFSTFLKAPFFFNIKKIRGHLVETRQTDAPTTLSFFQTYSLRARKLSKHLLKYKLKTSTKSQKQRSHLRKHLYTSKIDSISGSLSRFTQAVLIDSKYKKGSIG